MPARAAAGSTSVALQETVAPELTFTTGLTVAVTPRVGEEAGSASRTNASLALPLPASETEAITTYSPGDM